MEIPAPTTEFVTWNTCWKVLVGQVSGAVEFPLDSSMAWTVSLGTVRWWGESSTIYDWPIILGSRLWWREAWTCVYVSWCMVTLDNNGGLRREPSRGKKSKPERDERQQLSGLKMDDWGWNRWMGTDYGVLLPHMAVLFAAAAYVMYVLNTTTYAEVPILH